MDAPLTGIRVLDLTRVMSGPFATVLLADLGADVVKVETIGVGDIFRHMGGDQRGAVNAIFMGLNRGKRSIAVDFRRPGAPELLRELALGCDVVVENFRPGVAAALGLSAADLHAADDRLVYVSITGFGPDGPSAHDPAYDTIIQGRAGIAAGQRETPDSPADTVRSFISDKMGGVMAATSVLAALVARGRGARNQVAHVSLLDASMYYAFADGLQEIAFVGGGVAPGLKFSHQRTIFPTADGEVIYAAVSDRDRRQLARALGRSELMTDPRFASVTEGMKPVNYAAFQNEIGLVLRTLTTAECLERLRAADVPVAPVTEPADLPEDPHVVATHFFAEVQHPSGGPVRQPSFPATFGGERVQARRPAPLLGEHTTEVLIEAGLAPERIATLFAAGVIA